MYKFYRDFNDYDENFTCEFDGVKYHIVISNVGDEEVNKRWITVKDPNGEECRVDWSPYSTFLKSDFELWMRAGKPDRHTLNLSGPLNIQDLEKICAAMNKN